MKKTCCLMLVLFLCNIAFCRSIDAQESDPVRVIWEEFLASSDALTAIDEWVEKILLVIEQNPSSPARFRANVLANLAGSCNSAKRYDKSIELMHKSLLIEESVYERLVTIGHLGAVHEILYEEADEQGNLEKTKEHAESVLKCDDQFTKELVANDANLSSEEKFDLQGRLIFFKRSEADILRDVKGDTEASLKKYDEALELLSSNPELTERGILQGMGFDAAFFHREKAETLLAEGDLQQSIAGMIEYGKSSPESKEHKSFMARKFAESAFPKRGKDYRDFLNRWFNEVPHDKETVVILRDIGKSYFNEGLYEEAIEVCESIRQSWWQQALDLDPIALKEQRGGYFADVLRILCESYQKTNQLDKSALCLEELKRLVPKDFWVPILEETQEQAVVDHENAEIVRKIESGEFKSGRPWGIIIGVNAVFIALIIILLFLQRRK